MTFGSSFVIMINWTVNVVYIILKGKKMIFFTLYFWNTYICLNIKCTFIFKTGSWAGSKGCFLSELQEFNVYFSDTEESFCFIYLLWVAASQCHGTSFSGRLNVLPKKKKISNLLNSFLCPQTKRCVSTLSPLSSACKHPVYKGCWTI